MAQSAANMTTYDLVPNCSDQKSRSISLIQGSIFGLDVNRKGYISSTTEALILLQSSASRLWEGRRERAVDRCTIGLSINFTSTTSEARQIRYALCRWLKKFMMPAAGGRSLA